MHPHGQRPWRPGGGDGQGREGGDQGSCGEDKEEIDSVKWKRFMENDSTMQ